MELIKRTTLHYQAGTSNKIYELDICRMSGDRYVVNFRYGDRSKNLEEGTKTVQPVSLIEAQRIIDRLVRRKINRGYSVTTDLVSDAPLPLDELEQENTTFTNRDPRHQAILNRLANRSDRKWPLERVIWRAGELKIREAVPLLIQLLGTGEPLRDYCIIWALGWCGDSVAVLHLIRKLSQEKSTPEFVRRITWEALFKLSDEQTKAAMLSQKIEELPSPLRELAKNGTTEAFAAAFGTYLNNSDYRCFAVIDTIYQIDNEVVRPVLIAFLRSVALQPNYFKAIRHIFKMAEYRHDEEVFSILAYRFEKESGNFDNYRTGWKYYDSVTRRYRRSGERLFINELKNPKSKKAYSDQTREYLRRRVWRTLKQLGEEGDAAYIKLALSILLQYSDNDAEKVKESSFGRWNWDIYASYLTFNHILYENSPRYQPDPKAWRCREGYKPGNPEPQVREEAFPQLWNQHPEALLRLLQISKCTPVHHFAVKAIRECQKFCQQLDVETVIQLLGKPYEVTVRLGFELASDRYNPTQPNYELVLVLANCILPAGRDRAYQWIGQQREYFLASSEFIASLVTSPVADTRAFVRKLLSSSILNDTTARVLIGRIIAAILGLQPTQEDIVKEISGTLLGSFAPQLRNLGFGVILDLLGHPMPEVQALGALLLLNHETPAVNLPPDLIESLLDSHYDAVRGVGVRIFGQLPDERLMSDRILIIAMAVNVSVDIRHAIRPIIRRLATNYPNFGIELAIDFIDLLTEPERHEGVHKDLVLVLREDLSGWISQISKETILQLTRAKTSVAQELGGMVLQESSDRIYREFISIELVKLANHEILAVREAARRIFWQKLDSIRCDSQEMLAAVKMLESKWDDSREFAMELFGNLSAENWTPEVMVSVCDSIKPEVRRFGRDLVTRYFHPNYGQEYLLKFSEHPSTDMQMFATNYLETYAVNDPERLQELIPYFVRILSGVNKGSVAKQRIFSFLDKEAQKSESAAKVVAQILTRQSATMAIGDKASAIQTMVKIKRMYPEISLPILVKEVIEVRS